MLQKALLDERVMAARAAGARGTAMRDGRPLLRRRHTSRHSG